MAILIGAVIAWMIICILLGPEADGAHFEESKVATQRGAGGEVVGGREKGYEGEGKAAVEQIERVKVREAGRQTV